MKEFIIIIVILFFLVFICSSKPYISISNIHGNGLFANKYYKKGDIIYKNLFPHNYSNQPLLNQITYNDFQKYILKQGKYINHCSYNHNIDILTNDYIKFRVVATKDIPKHQELTIDYDHLNKRYPFIASSSNSFKKC